MRYNKNNIKAVLFDMDGTLIDTEPIGIQTLNYVCLENNIKLTNEELELFDKVWRRDGTDITTEEFLYFIINKYNPEINKDIFINYFYTKYEEAIVQANQLPGADNLLRRLYGKYKIALVTASTKSQALAVINKNKWGKIFDIVLSYDEYKIKKPDPVSFLMAASKLEVPPEDCVVIEDSKNGTKAGKNAGMYVIGIQIGNKIRQDLSAADVIYNTLADIVYDKYFN